MIESKMEPGEVHSKLSKSPAIAAGTMQQAKEISDIFEKDLARLGKSLSGVYSGYPVKPYDEYNARAFKGWLAG